jgi:hypothetical protein
VSKVDLQTIQLVQFGVCLSDAGTERFALVPVDVSVQDALKGMAQATADQLRCFQRGVILPLYEPAEKYGPTEALRYPIGADETDTTPVVLFQTQNLPIEQAGLEDPSEIVFYFAIFHDRNNRKLVAIRRAIQFKGVLKAKGRLIRWNDDTMQLVHDDIFKLDEDFDYLVTLDEIYILRPSGFEHTADMASRVLAKATQNTAALQTVLTCVDFGTLATYVGVHTRAARLVASIKARDNLVGRMLAMTTALKWKISMENSGLRRARRLRS